MSATEGIRTTTSEAPSRLTPSFLMWVWKAMDVVGIVEARQGMTQPMPLPTAFWLVMSNGARNTN